MTPNADGKIHLVDTKPIYAEIEPLFDAMNDINYVLFTRRNPTVGQRIDIRDMNSVRNSNWNANNPTRFLIHGWNGDERTGLNIFMRDQFLSRADLNIVVVDWSAGAQTINYISARNRVAAAGNAIGILIERLVNENLARFDNIILVGHSLGSHVAGNTGKAVTGTLQAIYGTDPAGPLFNANSADRLAINDAAYTEALHTNAGNLGFNEPITMAAFYPNWGSSQPGKIFF